LKRLWHNEKLKLLWIASGAYMLVIGWQSLAGKITFEEFLGGAFWVAGPLAAAALGRELRCCLPYFAAVGALLLFWSGCTSENFTGLPGNWNWNCGILTALIPGIFLAGKYKYWKSYSMAALALFFAVWFCVSPEKFPRAALFAALAAWIVIFLRNRMPEKYFYRTLVAVTGIAAGIFFLALSVLDLPDTRFQIWRGAWNFLMGEPLTGAGAGHFSEVIRENLHETFYFTEFATGHIDHAHNDLLNIFAECGIAGAIFYFAAIFTILPGRTKSGQGILAKWIFAVMLFCGCFDQHNITVTGGFCLALSAGILLMPEGRKPVALPCRLAIPGMVAGVILLFLAVSDAVVNYQVTTFIRQGDLKLLRGDIDGALASYADSMRQKKTIHALYQSAELYLVKQRPDKTIALIGTMNDELHIVNYRHTNRLLAVAALQTGDLQTASAALNSEMLNAPYSVINAHFQCFLVRVTGMDASVTAAADQHLTELCRMRGIEVSDIQCNWSVEMDDAAFAPEVRQSYFSGQ
jgi:O-antigen ligase